jgi:glycosyltransferase involved in cell wall biosynthesis
VEAPQSITAMTKKNSPLVSVIIPFLNEERFLKDAVESVLQQDYANWELLLVDDGSTDESTNIAKEYSSRIPEKIFFCEHEGHKNKGLSASRNLGIEKAKGELIAPLDADDVWLPGKLSDQIAIFQRHPEVAMVIEASDYWYNWNDTQLQNVKIAVGAPPNRVYEPPHLMEHLYPLGSGAAPCPSGLIFKKSAFARAGGFEESFKKEYGLYEDQAFLSKIYLREKVFVSSSCNNMYRQRPESIVYSVYADGKYHLVKNFFLSWLENHLENMHITDRQISKLLKKAQFPYRSRFHFFLNITFPQKLRRLLNRVKKI